MVNAEELKIGDPVYVDCIENFGGPAIVIDIEESPDGYRCKVLMDDGNPSRPFWAHNLELEREPQPARGVPDTRRETLDHIVQVRAYLDAVIANLKRRRGEHDLSKLLPPEREAFDRATERLRGLTYGSDEYRACLADLKPALDHHYAANSHHPEHYPDGIRGMSLLDLTEMLVDWKAATLRHADGDLLRSIEINQKRFGYSDELKRILLNTVAELGLAGSEPAA
jgi:hypothetical protein